MSRHPGRTGRWLVRTWVVEADTAGEARAAASEHGRPLTETVSSLATEPPAAMPVSRPGRPAYSTDFCPQLITFTSEEDGREQVAPCGSRLTVVATTSASSRASVAPGTGTPPTPANSRTAPAGRQSASAHTTRASFRNQRILGSSGRSAEGRPWLRSPLAWQVTRQPRTVHGVLACAVVAAQVGWVVQPVRSCGPSNGSWNDKENAMSAVDSLGLIRQKLIRSWPETYGPRGLSWSTCLGAGGRGRWQPRPPG